MEKSSYRQDETLPDTLTQRIGVLTRREVEARVLAPLIKVLGERFGHDEVLDIVRGTIVQIAQQQGSELAEAMGGSGSAAFIQSLEFWQKDDALKLDILEQEAGRLDFNVTRCRYAEMYRALGVPELGALLSCNRDFALTAGFNPDARLTRTQTIMEGAPYCDFRYIFLDEIPVQS
jgi:hypothetical protein